MGCGKSKDAQADPKLTFVVKPTTIADVDSILEAFKADVEYLEKLRRDLEDTRAEARALSGTIRLVDEKIRFAEATRVFLWAVSANYGGRIASSNIRIEKAPPLLTVDTGSLTPDTEKLYNLIKDYLNAAVNAKTNFTKGFENLKAKQETIKALKDTLPDKIKDKGAGEKLTILAAMAQNAQQAGKVVENANRLRVLCDDQQKEQEQVVNDMSEWVKEADQVGEAASREKHLRPIQIFDKFHKGEKTPETTA